MQLKMAYCFSSLKWKLLQSKLSWYIFKIKHCNDGFELEICTRTDDFYICVMDI